MASFWSIDAEINKAEFRAKAIRRPKLDAADQIDLGVPVGTYVPSRSKKKSNSDGKKGKRQNHGNK
jgi:hypothetical protein